MSTTSSVTDSNSASAIFAALNGTATKTSSSNASDSQNRFLKLLTAQLKNQDPLNPMDNAQMTSQLAQISTVDGIERLNATLQSLISDSATSQTLQAASVIGKGVLVPGSSLVLDSGSAFGGIDLAADADTVTVSIIDSNGLPMRTLNLGSVKAGSHVITWDGKTDNGVAAANGSYTFTVAAEQGGSKVAATALMLGLVSSITSGSSGLSLNVGQQQFSMADVRQIL